MYYSIHWGTQRIAMNYFYVVCLNFALVGKKKYNPSYRAHPNCIKIKANLHKSGAWRSILFLKDNKKSVCYFNIIHPITILAQRNFAEIKYPIAYFSFFALFARKKLYELNRSDILFSTRNFVPFTINIFAKIIGNECEVKLSLTI